MRKMLTLCCVAVLVCLLTMEFPEREVPASTDGDRDKLAQNSQVDVVVGRRYLPTITFAGADSVEQKIARRTELPGPGAGVETHADLSLGSVGVPNGVIATIANSDNKRMVVGRAARIAKLPVGEYRIDSWTMERRDKEGNRWSVKGMSFGKKGFFDIVEGQTVKLAIGEPILSSLSASKKGSAYRIGHGLRGQMGEKIHITKNAGRPEPPRLKISSSDNSYQETLIFAYG